MIGHNKAVPSASVTIHPCLEGPIKAQNIAVVDLHWAVPNKIWTLPSGVGMWVSHWNMFLIIPVSMTYTGAIIILR